MRKEKNEYDCDSRVDKEKNKINVERELKERRKEIKRKERER